MSARRLHSWREALTAYAHPRVLALFFLGFAAGLPFLLVFSTLSAWLTEAEVSRATIGFFSWVGITFSVKVFWAPVVDRLPIPGLTRWLGRRRSWMLLAQAGIMAGLAGMALTDPQVDLAQLALFAVLVAFSSATQDIAIDAFRIESADQEYQGAMAAMYIFGYRVALLVAGAGALYTAEYAGWVNAYFAMAAMMGVGVLTVLLVREPEHKAQPAEAEQRALDFVARNGHLPKPARDIGAWFVGAVICPFVDFFARNGRRALLILALVGLYKLSDITMGVMANPFYLDLGFSKTQIAEIAKVFGFGMSMAGTALGGLLVMRYGVRRPLLLGAALVAITNLLFAWLAGYGPSTAGLALVISADNLAGGLATAAFIAWLSGLTSSGYTATQYALFSSLMTLPAKFLGGFSGLIVEAEGYVYFFSYAAALGLPAILLCLWLLRDAQPQPEPDTP